MVNQMKHMDKVDIGNGVYATVVDIFTSIYSYIKQYLRYERIWNGLWLYRDALDRYYILLDPRDES